MKKPSGPAILMYILISLSAAVCAVCFTLHYGAFNAHEAILWIGIVAFMLVYHLWLRLILGNVSKLFTIRADMAWFRERRFEKKLYAFLRVKKWKDKMPTYNPESFSLKSCSLAEIADTMAKSETDHWLNEGISLLSILFSLIWGQTRIFLLTALGAMIFDSLFIIMQRYNRPRILRLMRRERREVLSV